MIDRPAQQRRARELLAPSARTWIPTRRRAQLSVAQRQLVEIAKALRHEARVLIMDEPTAALTEAETGRLFAVIRGLTARGVAVVYISHRMPEIFAIGDRVTVMRDGATVDTRAVAGTTVEALIAAMVGRPLAEQIPKRSVTLGEPRLQVVDLRQGAALGPVSFEVRAGEIFGLAGLMGSGRTEVARAIFGADRPSGGEVRVAGRRLDGTVRGAIAAGVGLVTEDRKAQGLVLDCTAAENITLAVLGRLTRLGLLDLPGERRLAEGFRERMRIRLHSTEQRVRTLSGGNQQKVVMARWLATECQVLILDEPTRGVDVGAKAEIYELIGELAGRGVAVLLISSELPEVLGLCDRIGVMRERRLAGILPRGRRHPGAGDGPGGRGAVTDSMKLLLTSNGVTNAAIRQALRELLGRPFSESRAVFIPTAAHAVPGRQVVARSQDLSAADGARLAGAGRAGADRRRCPGRRTRGRRPWGRPRPSSSAAASAFTSATGCSGRGCSIGCRRCWRTRARGVRRHQRGQHGGDAAAARRSRPSGQRLGRLVDDEYDETGPPGASSDRDAGAGRLPGAAAPGIGVLPEHHRPAHAPHGRRAGPARLRHRRPERHRGDRRPGARGVRGDLGAVRPAGGCAPT